MNGKCEKCGDYGWELVNGICTICLDDQKVKPEVKEKQMVCSYCGKPASEEFEIWVNHRRVKKLFCSKTCANYAQMGAEG